VRLTCSSRDSDAARLRDLALLSTVFRVALLLVGLSGGDSCEAGVMLVSAVDRASESSPYLSNMGSLLWLSGESDILNSDIDATENCDVCSISATLASE